MPEEEEGRFSYLLIEAVQSTLRLREQALSDLLLSSREKQLSDWGRMRLHEIDVHNSWLAAIARRYGCKPKDLVDAANEASATHVVNGQK